MQNLPFPSLHAELNLHDVTGHGKPFARVRARVFVHAHARGEALLTFSHVLENGADEIDVRHLKRLVLRARATPRRAPARRRRAHRALPRRRRARRPDARGARRRRREHAERRAVRPRAAERASRRHAVARGARHRRARRARRRRRVHAPRGRGRRAVLRRHGCHARSHRRARFRV